MHTDDTDGRRMAPEIMQEKYPYGEQGKITADLMWNDVSWMKWFLKRYNVDLDAICRETCRRVNGRRRR